MNIGKLNRRITVTTYGANTLTATGGYTKGAETNVTTWCAARPLSQKETLLNGLQLGQRNYEFTFRYEQGTNVSQETKITYDSREFKVSSIIEIDDYKRVVKVLAAERTN
jgi:SPP1 family predicted phage head-tail adaptor